MPQVKQRSSVWNHFVEVEKGKKVTCKHCGKASVLANGSTGNLLRHMRIKHAEITLDKPPPNITYIPNRVNCTAAPEQRNTEIEYPTIEIQSAKSVNVAANHNAEPNHQPTAYFLIQSYDLGKREEVDKQLLKMIVKGLHPFNIIEEPEFIKFVNILNPCYVLPNCKTLSSELLPSIYQLAVEELKLVLNEVTSVALATDHWTSVNNEHFISVTAHYLGKDLKLKTSFLECASSYQPFNSASIALFFQELSIKWGLANKILAVVTTDMEDMVKAVNICQWNHIYCFAHILNEVVKAGLAEIVPFISKVRNVVQYFKRNSIASSKLSFIQIHMGLSHMKLKKDAPSRWDSTFNMLVIFLKNKVPLLSAIEELHLYSFQITTDDFVYLENVIKILMIFNSTRVEICSEKSVSLSKIPYMVSFMSKRLAGILEHAGLHPEIVKMGNVLKDGLKRFEVLEVSEIVLQSVLLDPRFKRRGFTDNFFEEASSTLHQNVIAVREEIKKDQNEEISGSTNTEEPRIESEYFIDMWSEFDSKDSPQQQTLSTVASAEIDTFLNEAYLSLESDPLTYWGNVSNQNKFPALFELAKRVLCIPSISVPCQRMYFNAGSVFMAKRNRLTSAKTKEILFLNHNL